MSATAAVAGIESFAEGELLELYDRFLRAHRTGGSGRKGGQIFDQHAFSVFLDLVLRIKVYGSAMDIALLYFTGCPNWTIADERLATIAAGRPDITVTRHLVESIEDAERLGFHGSPTILVDGVDPFADPDAPVGLSCRIYQTPDGPAGAPTVEQLQGALART